MGMKKKAKSKIEAVQICPKCGSPNIETDFSNAAAVSYGVLQTKKCNNCGQTGQFFPKVAISKLKKPKKASEIKDIQRLDISVSYGIIGLMKIIGIFMVVGGLGLLFITETYLGIYSIILGLLVSLYGFLYKNHKKKTSMKILMIIILLYAVFGPILI